MNRSYSELVRFQTFEERFEYLCLHGMVGKDTFGYDRYLNQILYNSDSWKRVRRKVIIRDEGCDLGCVGFEIHSGILIHHINPITVDDVVNRNPIVFDMNNLISTVLKTHNAIHYGDIQQLTIAPVERIRNDTCPWRH